MGQLVWIATFDSIPEALCAKAAIERLGIPCCLCGYEMASMNWLYLHALSGISLWAPDSARETAAVILDSVDRQSVIESAPEAFARRPLLNAIALAVTLFLGAPTPLWLRKRTFRRSPE